MLEQRLRMSYDHIASWIRSVEEAWATLSFQETIDREAAQRFFSIFQPQPPQQEQEPETSDSSYQPFSNEDDPSLSSSYHIPTTVASTTSPTSGASIPDSWDPHMFTDEEVSHTYEATGLTSTVTSIYRSNSLVSHPIQVSNRTIPDSISCRLAR